MEINFFKSEYKKESPKIVTELYNKKNTQNIFEYFELPFFFQVSKVNEM